MGITVGMSLTSLTTSNIPPLEGICKGGDELGLDFLRTSLALGFFPLLKLGYFLRLLIFKKSFCGDRFLAGGPAGRRPAGLCQSTQ